MANTTMDAMTTRLIATLRGYGVNANTATENVLWVNQTIEKLCAVYKILKDSFTYTTVAGTTAYQLNSVSPFPKFVTDVKFGSTDLVEADLAVVEADLAAGNTTVWRFAIYKDGANWWIKLNAAPGTSSVIVTGAYLPDYVAAGANELPLPVEYDNVVEAGAVGEAVKVYVYDINVKTMANNNFNATLAEMGLKDGHS